MAFNSASPAKAAVSVIFACFFLASAACAAPAVAQGAVAPPAPTPPAENHACAPFCGFFSALKRDLSPSTPPSAVPAPAQPAIAKAAPSRPRRRIASRRQRPRFEPARVAAVRFYGAQGVIALPDLSGQPVSLGLKGSRTRELARRELTRAGVSVEEVPLDPSNAFDALGIGAIKAVAVSGAREYAMMDAIPARYGVHRLAEPQAEARRSSAHERTAALSTR
jgi:hypothetical protein